MKRYVKSEEMIIKGKDWLNSEEAEELMQGCTTKEKKIIRRISNAKYPKQYAEAVVATILLLEVPVSDSFRDFMESALGMI